MMMKTPLQRILILGLCLVTAVLGQECATESQALTDCQQNCIDQGTTRGACLTTSGSDPLSCAEFEVIFCARDCCNDCENEIAEWAFCLSDNLVTDGPCNDLGFCGCAYEVGLLEEEVFINCDPGECDFPDPTLDEFTCDEFEAQYCAADCCPEGDVARENWRACAFDIIFEECEPFPTCGIEGEVSSAPSAMPSLLASSSPSGGDGTTAFPTAMRASAEPSDGGDTTAFPTAARASAEPSDGGDTTAFPTAARASAEPSDGGDTTAFPTAVRASAEPSNGGDTTAFPTAARASAEPSDGGDITAFPTAARASAEPTNVETPGVSNAPSAVAVATPSPTQAPTEAGQTRMPTTSPTQTPTSRPTASPSMSPSRVATPSPTNRPTLSPAPTVAFVPTLRPVALESSSSSSRSEGRYRSIFGSMMSSRSEQAQTQQYLHSS